MCLDASMTAAWADLMAVTMAPQLILEVVGQLQRMFNPDLRMIKKRIEDLISREYIERDPVRCQSFWFWPERSACSPSPQPCLLASACALQTSALVSM